MTNVECSYLVASPKLPILEGGCVACVRSVCCDKNYLRRNSRRSHIKINTETLHRKAAPLNVIPHKCGPLPQLVASDLVYENIIRAQWLVQRID